MLQEIWFRGKEKQREINLICTYTFQLFFSHNSTDSQYFLQGSLWFKLDFPEMCPANTTPKNSNSKYLDSLLNKERFFWNLILFFLDH